MRVQWPMGAISAWGYAARPYCFTVLSYPYGFSLNGYNHLYGAYAPGVFQRRRTWHGIINILEKYTIPRNPRSPMQTSYRNTFADGVYCWNHFTTYARNIYNDYGYPIKMSGYNRFLHYYLKQNFKFQGSEEMTWTEVTTTSETAAPDNGYVANNASLVTITLPSVCAFGKIIRVAGKGAGGWSIAQNAGQNIIFGSQSTTTGVNGNIASINKNDAIELLCIVADTTFEVISSQGVITVN